MIELTTVEGLKAAASAWPGGRPLHVEAFGRRMVAATAFGDNGVILLRLHDDGKRLPFEAVIAEKDAVIANLTAAIAEKDALIAELQPKTDEPQPSQPATDVADPAA